jgi:hypothetical protein
MKGETMKRIIFVISFALVTALGASAQGKSQATPPGAAHSNAPSGTPAASQDRDKGTARAEDVGKGKKKGVTKSKTPKKANTAPKKENKK